MKLKLSRHIFLGIVLAANVWANSDEPTTVGETWVNQALIQQSVYNLQNQSAVPAYQGIRGLQHPDVINWQPQDLFGTPGELYIDAFGSVKMRNGTGSPSFMDGNAFRFGITQNRTSEEWDVDLTSVRTFGIDISNPTSVYSCEAPHDEVEILANAVNWSGCYADRRSYVTEPSAPDAALLTRDQEVCSCLRSSPVEAVQHVMGQDFVSNRGNTSAFSDRVKANMHAHWQQNSRELNDIYSDTMNSFLFQANVVSRGEDPTFVGIMSQNIFGNPPEGTPVFQPTADGHVINPRQDVQLSLLNDDAYPPGQCISPMEFLALKQLPIDSGDGPFIKEDLGKSPATPDDLQAWDYNKLQAEYNELMGLSIGQRNAQREQILKLKAKLKYLNRNPMIKYIMGASPSDLDLLSGSSSISEEIRNVFNSTNFSNLKQEMYSIMSRVKGNCDITCINSYHTDLKKFFDEDQNRILLASLEAHKDSMRKMNNKVNVTDYLGGNVSTPKQRDIVAEFRRNYGMRAPDECNAGSALTSSDAIGCLDIYAAYCRTLDKYGTQIQDMSGADPAILDNLDQLMANDLETDINKNQEFQDFNNAVCNTPRDGGLLNLGREFNFFSYKDHECGKKRVPQCDLRTPADYAYFRAGFDALRRPDERKMGPEVFNLYSLMTDLAGTSQMSTEDITSLQNAKREEGQPGAGGLAADPFSRARNYVEDNRRRRLEDSQMREFSDGSTEVASVAAERSYANAGTNTNANNNRAGRNEAAEETYVNYSNLNAGNADIQNNTTAQNNSGPQRVQDMDQERREELMEDWENEYNIWKERYGSDKSPATAAQDTQYRTEISTLRALLDQQRQISDQQYQLLNDAIAARSRIEQENLQRDQERERSVASADRRSGGSGVVSRNSGEEDIARGPASIAEPQFNTSGVNGGGASSSTSSAGASIGGSSSGNSAALGSSGSSDSVAREEAKLVNLRRFSDGSIIIESSSNGNGGAVNAITVPVSDEQYRILQTNPQGLNLSQIERSIPEEQISQLERNGEIILLLRNGQNPPFEVKVEKRDNRLVYSVRDQNSGNQVPVRRVHLRSSLENLTKQFTNPN